MNGFMFSFLSLSLSLSLSLYLLCGLVVVPTEAVIQARVLKSGVVNFAPWLKLHHIVVVTNLSDMYTIDFTYEGRDNGTKLKLVLGKSVPAEVRLRKLSMPFYFDVVDIDRAILEEWTTITENDADDSKRITEETYENIQDDELEKFFGKFVQWNGLRMNLYKANCQHFSDVVLLEK